MTIRKNLTSVLLTGTMLLGGSLIGMNQAEANAWMVKKVSKASQPYCAMIKRYSNDRVLSFAQRDNAEISTAIDFGDKFLDKGRAYSITLSDGSGFSRRFEVKPASSSAVVIKMNRKDPILERIAQKGDLDVNIAGVVSTFNVADLDKGLDQLETCSIGAPTMRSADASSSAAAMADIAPAAGDSVVDTQSSAHTLYSTAANAKIRELETAKKDLEASIKANEAKIADLENQLLSKENVAKTQQNALVNEVTNLKAALEQQSFETSQLKVKLTDRDEKIAFYQSTEGQVSDLQSKLTAAEANLAAAMEQNNALSAQIVSLQSTTEQIGDQAAVIGQLNAQIAQLQQANTSLNQQIAQLRTASANASQSAAVVSQKDMEISNLHSALQSAQSTIASLQQALADSAPAAGDSAEDIANAEHISALGAKLKAVEAEKQSLNMQLSALQREMDTAQRETTDTSKFELTIARLEKALDEANRSLDKAGKENAALYQKMVQTEKELEEVRVTKNDSKNWDVQKATSRYEEAQREIRRLAMHVENSKKQCEIEKAEIEQLLFDPKITEKEQQQKLSALEGKITELNKAQQSCEAQVAELNAEASAMKMAAIQAKEIAQIQPAAGMAAPAVAKAPETVAATKMEDRSIALISVLKDANLEMNTELKNINQPLNVADARFEQGYSWKSGKITGSYERFVVKGGDAASWAGAYNNALSAQCSGDFAVMPSKKNTASISANDTACVNGDFGTTTSIVFTQNGDYLDVYKLSGSIQDMTKLMDSRESIASSVGKSL